MHVELKLWGAGWHSLKNSTFVTVVVRRRFLDIMLFQTTPSLHHSHQFLKSHGDHVA